MKSCRQDFPFFVRSSVDEIPVYLDSAATTQKPETVIQAISEFYRLQNAPLHRGIYTLAEQATSQFERVREQVARFVGANSSEEIVFTKGATDGINIAANAWAHSALKPGDEILITELEHHANIVPWQKLSQELGLILRWIPIRKDGTLDVTMVPDLLSAKIKLVACTADSNVLGLLDNLVTQQDYAYLQKIYGTQESSFLKILIREAQNLGARVLLDLAQYIPHKRVSLRDLGCDFAVFSAHKMLGPTGVGVLYVKKELHDQLATYQVGGGMVFEVHQEKFIPKKMPHKLEAGTPHASGVIGFGAALSYLETLDLAGLLNHEALLSQNLRDALTTIPGITVLGPELQYPNTGHLVSFTVESIHPHDVAAYLDQYNIYVRAGNHCAQILHKKLGIDGSVRASFYCYNTLEDIEKLSNKLRLLIT
jgi:cysteine desulfurase/selenocysteine lyase